MFAVGGSCLCLWSGDLSEGPLGPGKSYGKPISRGILSQPRMQTVLGVGAERSEAVEWGGLWHYVGRCVGHGGQVRDTDMEKDVPKGKEQCRTQGTSELKASSQSHAHTSL